MAEREWIDLGSGYAYSKLPQGIWLKCPHTDNEYGSFIPVLPTDKGWTRTQEDPLTLTPSINMLNCGCHGFVTEGKWVPA